SRSLSSCPWLSSLLDQSLPYGNESDARVGRARGPRRESTEMRGISAMLTYSGRVAVAISLAALGALKPERGSGCIVVAVERLHHRLAAVADPSPVANERSAAKQGRLDGERIETPHVLGRVDAAKVNWCCFDVIHGESLASSGSGVQRHC